MQALDRTRDKALAEGPWKAATRRVEDDDIVRFERKRLREGRSVLLDEAHVPHALLSGSFRIGLGVRE